MIEERTTALVQIAPAANAGVVALYEEGTRALQYAQARVIQSDDDAKTATNDLAIIAGRKKLMEERRKEYTGPLNDLLKSVNEAFKNLTQPWNQADALTRQKVLAYRAEQERVRQEQERINTLRMEAARAEMALKGELSEPVGLVPVIEVTPARYRTDAGTLGTAKVWRFEVVDFALLPSAYKMPDMSKIRKVIAAGVSIPGVRAWQEEGLRVTVRE